MNSETEKAERAAHAIYDYLRRYGLPKVACLTTCVPNKSDKEHLFQYFNYLCFCASSMKQVTHFLLMRYLARFGKTPFDVVISTPVACLNSRRYGYVCLEEKDSGRSAALVAAIGSAKDVMSREYSILLRIKGSERSDYSDVCSNCVCLDQLDRLDRIFEIR